LQKYGARHRSGLTEQIRIGYSKGGNVAHILIIDDSPTDVRVFTTLLEKSGHRVSSAGSAEEGIARAKRERPDLVIMDVIMPGMNGFQATRTLSRDNDTSSIPILIVTTKSMETDRVWGLRQGAKDFVTKPVSANDLLARIQNLLPN
jgi:twitching motility two-component system response regulator PilH